MRTPVFVALHFVTGYLDTTVLTIRDGIYARNVYQLHSITTRLRWRREPSAIKSYCKPSEAACACHMRCIFFMVFRT